MENVAGNEKSCSKYEKLPKVDEQKGKALGIEWSKRNRNNERNMRN